MLPNCKYQVASQLEDSLTVAASALALVKSVEPNIITIQVSNCETYLEKIKSHTKC